MEQKEIRGIYLSRYQATNNADEETIRRRVRYYREQGINTLIHGVWGNGCTMYDMNHLDELVNNTKIKNILVFPAAGNPEEAAALFQKFTVSNP